MAMNVRRIVTGHNAAGKAVIKTDEQIAAVARWGGGISAAEIWSTRSKCRSTTRRPLTPPNEPVSLSTPKRNDAGDGGDDAPNQRNARPRGRITHRTETLDYVIVLSGEINCEWKTVRPCI